MSEENPWRTHKSQVVYQNAFFTLREDSVTRPDGKEGTYSWFETRTAVAVVALTPESEVYLVGQYRYPTKGYSWELVEGGADCPSEDPLVVAQRELREEAGLLAATWTPLGGEIHLSNCISAEAGYIFLAEDLTETDAEPEGTEVLQVKKVPFEEALEMVHSGVITDGFAILGLLKAEHYLKNRSRRTNE
jgi:8-oxo-dGTP pyrophosphatase MutT (NUDIX family)